MITVSLRQQEMVTSVTAIEGNDHGIAKTARTQLFMRLGEKLINVCYQKDFFH